jgi:hypothetical protein
VKKVGCPCGFLSCVLKFKLVFVMVFLWVLEVFVFVCVGLCILYYNNAPGIFSLIKRKVKIKWCFEMAGFEIESGC